MKLKYSEIIERIMQASDLKSGSAIARSIGMSPQAFSNHKCRDGMPGDIAIKLAETLNLSLDWLIRGEGEVYREGFEPPERESGNPCCGKHKAQELSLSISPKTMSIIAPLIEALEGNANAPLDKEAIVRVVVEDIRRSGSIRSALRHHL